MTTKQAALALLVVILLFTPALASCVPGGVQAARGWAGTAYHDGIVYAGTGDGRVMAVDVATQSLSWYYPATVPSSGGMSCGPAPVSAAIYTTPLVDGDLVYTGTYSGRVLALNTVARSQGLHFPQRGYGEWEWDCPKNGAASNAIVADLRIGEDAIYVSSSNGRVYSLDKGFGDLIWESEVLDSKHRKLWTSPWVEDGTVYVSTFDGHIHALSTETGKPRTEPPFADWPFRSETGFASSPVLEGGVVYAGSFGNNLYAIPVGESELLWEFAGGKWFWADPLVSGGVVYAGCLDGKVYAVGAATGEEQWHFETTDARGRRVPIVSSPVMMDDLLVIVDEAGTVYVFDLAEDLANRAEPLRVISIGANVRSSFCAHEGVVYIRGEDNWLHAVGIDKGEVSWRLPLTIEE
jgi:eukaryotic-like serine/threonine-protein kinase